VGDEEGVMRLVTWAIGGRPKMLEIPVKLQHDVITLRVCGASQLRDGLHRSSDVLNSTWF
jgi:hypothetical protein